jgi:2,5-diketo-D-gluconate reductase A
METMRSNGVPTLSLSSGYDIPQLGLGVFRMEPDDAARVVSEAFEVGYRHIDTAKVYDNEEGVGQAIAQSGLDRKDLFITTKLWNADQGATEPRAALEGSLERLGLDYVDLYLIHWPAPAKDLYLDSWLAMEQLHAEGLVRSIGVSNFEPEHLERLAAHSSTMPVVNQVELHPAFQQRELRAFQEPRGILTEAWGPLGQGKYSLEEQCPGLVAIAAKHGKSIAQVVIRWHLQEGVIVFPKTVRKERLIENFDVFDFELDASDMSEIAAMDAGKRVGTHPMDGNW